MLRILHNTNIDFLRLRKIAAIITLAFILPGLVLIGVTGVRYSIEFTGGTLVRVHFAQPQQVGEIRSTLATAGIASAEIQQFGSPREFVIRAQEREQVEQQAGSAETVADDIESALTRRFGEGSYEVMRTEAVGPKVGSELRRNAIIAVLLSFITTLIYLAWRFEWRFGLAAVIATAHDILATVAFIKYMDLEVSLIVVGAILTVLGYSLNDTIVIFDRIREDLRLHKKMPLPELINRAVNETLPRTVTTGVTTIGSLLALLFFAGDVIRPFAWVLLFGIVVGTFSSVYIAAPVLLWIERRWPQQIGEKGIVGARARAAAEQGSTRKEPAGAR
jgi:preprotein translocase subunit SecF